MAANQIDLAHADVAHEGHDAGAMAQTLEKHAGTPMYVAEVVALLQDQRLWDGVKKHVHDHGLVSRGEHDAKTVKQAFADANAHGDDRSKIRNDIVDHNDDLYAEKYFAHLRFVGKLHNIQDVHDSFFRTRAGRALGLAELDGLVAGADVVKLGSHSDSFTGNGTPDDPMIGTAEATAESTVAGAKHKLEDAQKKLAALDGELQLQLKEIGPTLWDPNDTNPQRVAAAQRRVKAYVTDFKRAPRYQSALRNVQRLSASLHVEVVNHEADLEAMSHTDVAPIEGKHGLNQVIGSYRDLATTPSHAFEAVKWAASHLVDPTFNKNQHDLAEILRIGQETDAAKHVQNLAEIMRRSGDGETGKSAVLEAIHWIDEHIIRPYDIVERIHGLGELKEAIKHVQGKIQEFRTRNAKSIEQISVFVINTTSEGDPIVRRVGSAFGMMLTVVEDRNKIQLTANFVEIGDSVQEMYKAVASFRTTIDKGLKDKRKIVAEAEEIHGTFAKLARVMGPLSLAASALGVAEDVQELQKDGNPAVAVKLVGDMASTVGSAIALFPPLAPIGDAIGLLGAAISLIASGFVGDKVGDERRGDEKSHLIRTNAFDHGPHQNELAETFTNDDASRNLEDAEKLHLTLDQIKQLGAHHPFLFKDKGLIRGGDALRQFLGNADKVGRYHKGTLKSPYKDTLFGFLRAIHDDTKMKIAIDMYIGDGGLPTDRTDNMIDFAKQSLPHDAFAD